MKIELEKRPITIIFVIASILTCILAVFSIINENSWILRVLTQGSMCVTMLLNGVRYFIYKKQYAEATAFWTISSLFLYLFIYTCCIGIKYNLF